jgi:hypothetical protein
MNLNIVFNPCSPGEFVNLHYVQAMWVKRRSAIGNLPADICIMFRLRDSYIVSWSYGNLDALNKALSLLGSNPYTETDG